MENKMKNILLLGLLAVFLSSCSESVQEIQVTTVEVSKTPLNLPNPDPLKLQDVEWIIITKDNAMEIFEKLKGVLAELHFIMWWTFSHTFLPFFLHIWHVYLSRFKTVCRNLL